MFINLILFTLSRLLPVRRLDNLFNLSLPHSGRTIRMFSKINESLFEYISFRKALFLFKRTSKLVPAYKTFLNKKNIQPGLIKSISDFNTVIPQTSKENYIRAFPVETRCLNGKIPSHGHIEESSGTSGKSTFWIRSRKEETCNLGMVRATMNHLYDIEKNGNWMILNCFMAGGWTGGLRFASRLSSLGIVKNIGPDPQKTISFITEMGMDFSYLLGGYPPFFIDLINYGNTLKGFNWKNYKINIFSGGEGFVEEWREYVSSNLRQGSKIFSDYGAIDLDVGISTETPFTVAIRKLIKNDLNLRRDILSSDRLPSFIGQYSPQRFYIRETVNKDGLKEPEITVLNLKSVSPMIKYVIGDEGGVIRFKDIAGKLENRGYSIAKVAEDFNIPAVVQFPLIYIYGRSDGTVTINGSIISPSEIYEAILTDRELVSSINTFRLIVKSDTDNFIRLFIFLEMRKDVIISESLKDRSEKAIINKLLESNECFRVNYLKNQISFKPVIEIITFKTGIFAEKDGLIKHNYFL